MGFIPAGAYRNRDYAQQNVKVIGDVPLAMQDILYDPQTSGGLLTALPEKQAMQCIAELDENIMQAAIIGYVTEKQDSYLYLT